MELRLRAVENDASVIEQFYKPKQKNFFQIQVGTVPQHFFKYPQKCTLFTIDKRPFFFLISAPFPLFISVPFYF